MYRNYPKLVAEEILADYTSKYFNKSDTNYELPIIYEELLNNALEEIRSDVDKINSNPILPIKKEVRKDLNSNNVKTTGSIKTSNLEQNLRTSQISGVELPNMQYQSITNDSTMKQAKEKLNINLSNEVNRLMILEPQKATALDIAELIQLQYQYQQNGEIQSFQQTVDKLRQIGTNVGQAVQAFSILQRMTPEGMSYYAQRDLQNVFDEIAKNKNQKWINDNKEKFNLTTYEIEEIQSKMLDVQNLESQKVGIYKKDQQIERQQKIRLAQIQKLVNDKIPTNIGTEIKSYRRISMLLNPKTQIRNIMSNVLIAPVNKIVDIVGAGIDKKISKKTGIRTTGIGTVKAFKEGFSTGLKNTYQDSKMKIDTSNIEGNKFDIGRGKAFNNNTRLGKVLNIVEQFNNNLLKYGDAPFFEAEFNNSLQEQMKLNNVSEPNLDMIMTARDVALERTWQDDNSYTKSVLKIRKALNGNLNFGIGDILIPFAKTPANLTKAMIDYSPVGLVKSISSDLIKLNNAISKRENTAQLQSRVVRNISKGITGSLMYVIAYILRGIIKGEKDKDKDISDFERNMLGVQPYSFKIGNMSFTYDWAMPLATPFAIMSNLKEKEGDIFSNLLNGLGKMGDQLIDQSFLQGISNLFSNLKNSGFQGVVEGFFTDLPSSFIPTFLKQINDKIDPTQRITYEKGKPIKTAFNKAIAKVPIASQILAKKYDTLGNEVKKYGGANNIFNVFLNPANVALSKDSKVAKEIYRLYETTGDKTVFPRVANYTEKLNKKDIILTANQQSKIQETSGIEANKLIEQVLKNNGYQKLKDEEKVKIINDLVNYSYNKATNKVIGKELSPENKPLQKYIDNGLETSNAVIFKNIVNNIEGRKDSKGKTVEGSSSGQKALAIMNMNISNSQKNKMLYLMTTSKNPETVESLSRLTKTEKAYTEYFALNKSDTFFQTKISRDDMQDIMDLKINQNEFNKFAQNIGKIQGKKDKNGKTIAGSKKQAVAQYIESLNLKSGEKAILFAKAGYPEKQYKTAIYNYINELNLSATRKKEIWNSLGYK